MSSPMSVLRDSSKIFCKSLLGPMSHTKLFKRHVCNKFKIFIRKMCDFLAKFSLYYTMTEKQ